MTEQAKLPASEAIVAVALFAALAVPMFGAAMFMKTSNSDWLTLMIPLFIFMEAAFALGPIMLLIAALLVGWGVI